MGDDNGGAGDCDSDSADDVGLVTRSSLLERSGHGDQGYQKILIDRYQRQPRRWSHDTITTRILHITPLPFALPAYRFPAQHVQHESGGAVLASRCGPTRPPQIMSMHDVMKKI